MKFAAFGNPLLNIILADNGDSMPRTSEAGLSTSKYPASAKLSAQRSGSFTPAKTAPPTRVGLVQGLLIGCSLCIVVTFLDVKILTLGTSTLETFLFCDSNTVAEQLVC